MDLGHWDGTKPRSGRCGYWEDHQASWWEIFSWHGTVYDGDVCVYRYLYIYMYTVIWPTYICIFMCIYIYIYMWHHDLYQPRLRPPPLLMAVEVYIYIYTSLYVHITYSSFVGNDHDEMGHPFLANQPAKSCVGDFIATVRFCPFVYAHILYCMYVYIYIHIYTYVICMYTYIHA